jgi:hypothetical protein
MHACKTAKQQHPLKNNTHPPLRSLTKTKQNKNNKKVRKHGSAQKYAARVLAVGHECDLGAFDCIKGRACCCALRGGCCL